jgi:putative flippase GtrA
MASLSFALPRSRARRALKFTAVGASGLIVNQLAYAAMISLGGTTIYLLAAIGATQVSSTWNFLGSEYWVFSGRLSRGSRLGRYAAFLALNNATLLVRIPLLWLLADVAGIPPLIANPITLLMLWAFRFVFADGWIWRATSAARDAGTAKHMLNSLAPCATAITLTSRRATAEKTRPRIPHVPFIDSPSTATTAMSSTCTGLSTSTRTGSWGCLARWRSLAPGSYPQCCPACASTAPTTRWFTSPGGIAYLAGLKPTTSNYRALAAMPGCSPW